MSKFANSRDGIAAPLLLWQEIPTQISTLETYDLQVYPTTNIFAGGPIIFNLPPQARGMLWDVEIKTKLKIRSDHKPYDGDALKGLGIINNFANAIWELVELRLDDRIDLMQSMRNSYAYQTFFNHCFNTESAHADHLYHNQIFKMDSGRSRGEAENSAQYHFDLDTDKITRELNEKVFVAEDLTDYDYPEKLRRLKDMHMITQSSNILTGKHSTNPAVADRAMKMNYFDKSFSVSTKLQCPLLTTSKALPTNMKIRISLTKNSDDFLLYVTRKEREIYGSCEVIIEDVYLNVTYYEPRDVILRHIEDHLLEEPAPYFISRPEIIIKPITNANRNIRITNLFHDKLPNQAFLCLQRSSDFHGDRHTSPFIFEPYATCQLYVDGRPHFTKPLEAGYEIVGMSKYWSNNQEFFQQLYKTIGKDLVGDCLINSSNFHLNFMTAVNFTADRSSTGSRHLNLQKHATTSLEIDMGYDDSIPNDMILLIYAIFDRQVLIDGNRSIVVID